MLSHVVAEQQHQIGLQLVRIGDDLLDALDVHPRLASMDIGDQRDPELQRIRPVRHTRAVTNDAMAPGLDAEGIAAEAESREPKPRNSLEKCATR